MVKTCARERVKLIYFNTCCISLFSKRVKYVHIIVRKQAIGSLNLVVMISHAKK